MKLVHQFLAVFVIFQAMANAYPDSGELAKHLLAKAGISRGICSMPRCGDGGLVIAVAQSSRFLIHGLDSEPSAALKAADERGLLGKRIVVEKGSAPHLPYTDNMIDLIVVTDLADNALASISLTEVLRVLRPRGKAIIGRSAEAKGGKDALTEKRLRAWLVEGGVKGASVSKDSYGLWATISKPPIAGVDAWRHWQHGPDNNAVSQDTVIKAPYMTQWLGKPYYMAMPVVTTAAGGRTFVASGHIAHHDREIPTLHLITARNGYNGIVLWKRKLPEGYLTHRSAFIATDDTFYMIDGGGCLMLDAETGVEKGRISIPSVGGEWKWMAMKGGALYVLAGEKDPAAETKLVRSGGDHWGWGSLSKGYYGRPHIPWGFAKTIAAYDMTQKKKRWVHRESKPIDSRSMGICEGKVFFYSPESRIGCLDAASGKLLWSNTEEDVLHLIEERGRGLTSTPGFRTNCMILCTPKVIFFEAQTRMNVVALSAQTGEFLWKHRKTRNNPTKLFLDGRLLVNIGKWGQTLALDPMTGEELEDLKFNKAGCTRMTACPDSIFCRGEGLGRYDRATKTFTIDGAARPGCMDGAIAANGLLYVGPWLCDCNLSLIGSVALCSAGDFRFDYVATEKECLEVGEGNTLKTAELNINDKDWPTYRGNNQRSASTKATVPVNVTQLWEHKPKVPAKPTPPSSAGDLIFFGTDDGKVHCVDGKTGKIRWDFAAAGPVRLPPSLWEGRAYVGASDGYVYALEAATGRLLWRFRAAPIERRIMVYDSLRSTWPVNSGVLAADGAVYAAAGIIDHDGTYVYALDAKTGEIKWQNNKTGHLNKAIRKGASVQGDLTITEGLLWMAGGNQISPVPYRLETGECPSRRIPPGRPTVNRGCEVGVFKDRYVVRGGRLMYSGESKVVSSASFSFIELGAQGKLIYPEASPLRRTSTPPAWDGELVVAAADRYGKLACWDSSTFEALLKQHRGKLQEINKEVKEKKLDWRQRQRLAQKLERDMLKAVGEAVEWGPQNREVLALALAANAAVAVCEVKRQGEPGKTWQVYALDKKDGGTLWQQPLPSEPVLNGLLIDRNGQVVVALKNGRVICFGSKGVTVHRPR